MNTHSINLPIVLRKVFAQCCPWITCERFKLLSTIDTLWHNPIGSAARPPTPFYSPPARYRSSEEISPIPSMQFMPSYLSNHTRLRLASCFHRHSSLLMTLKNNLKFKCFSDICLGFVRLKNAEKRPEFDARNRPEGGCHASNSSRFSSFSPRICLIFPNLVEVSEISMHHFHRLSYLYRTGQF